jgi:hypothetical protein
MRKLAAAAAVLLFALVIPAMAEAVTLPKVPPSEGSPARDLKIRPAVIVYTGDGSGAVGGTHNLPRGGPLERLFGRLRWVSWTPTHAEAKGDDWLYACASLNCKDGHRSVRPATIRLSAPRVLGGNLIFTRFVLTTRGERRRELAITYTGGYCGY